MIYHKFIQIEVLDKRGNFLALTDFGDIYVNILHPKKGKGRFWYKLEVPEECAFKK